MKKTVINWSGGKDCMMALQNIRQFQPESELLLLTRFDAGKKVVSMHQIGEHLIEIQAKYLGLELKKVLLPELPDNITYNKIMNRVWKALNAAGYNNAVFGDIFLEDVRLWQEKQLAPFGINCHFPLWKSNTRELAESFIKLGYKAVIVAVDGEFFGAETTGRIYDRQFLDELPDKVDPCGENGEFHTFVFDGPGFKKPVRLEAGEPMQVVYPSPLKNGIDKKCWYTQLKQL